MTPEERLRTPLLRKWVFRRENCAGTWTPDGIPYETRPPASNPRRRFVFLRCGCGNSPSGEEMTPERDLRRAHRWRAPSRRPGPRPGIVQSLRPFWLRPPRQRPIVLPCPLGNDGEVWSSRRQRTRDGAHRLRGPSKADVQSSLHQPQPQSGLRGPASREAVGPTARGATSGRAREKTGASIKVVPRRHPSLGSMARDGFLLALERNALWRCPMTSSPLRRR